MKKVRIIAIVMAIILSVLVFVVAFNADKWFADVIDSDDTASGNKKNMETIYLNGEPYLPRNFNSYLLMGIDKDVVADEYLPKHEQTDFLALFVSDNDAKTYQIVYINRDTMVKVNRLSQVTGRFVSSKVEQIALAHTYGNDMKCRCLNTVDSVRELLHKMPIDKYVSLTMPSISIIADYLGDVQVTVSDDLTSEHPSLIQGTTVTLNQYNALPFIRARGGLDDSSNIARMGRQSEFIKGILNSVNDKDLTYDYLAGGYSLIKPYMITNCSTHDLEYIMWMLTNYEYKGSHILEGEAVKGEEYMEFYADDSAIQNLLAENFYVKRQD